MTEPVNEGTWIIGLASEIVVARVTRKLADGTDPIWEICDPGAGTYGMRESDISENVLKDMTLTDFPFLQGSVVAQLPECGSSSDQDHRQLLSPGDGPPPHVTALSYTYGALEHSADVPRLQSLPYRDFSAAVRAHPREGLELGGGSWEL